MENEIKSDSSKVHISLYAGEGNCCGVKRPGFINIAAFYGYESLAFPPSSRPDRVPYTSLTIGVRPAENYVPKNIDLLEDGFTKFRSAWVENPIGQHFHATFMRLPFPPYINKIVCINLGNFVLPDKDDVTIAAQHALFRHAAVITAAEALFTRFGRQIQILAQDTNYSPDCAATLFRSGFSIVGRHGTEGLAEIDDKTFVFAPGSPFCVKEVVADIAEPAGMFWETVLSPEESERVNMLQSPVNVGSHIEAYLRPFRSNSDTPRVRILTNKYDVHPFPGTNLFGSVSIYTRKGMSIAYTRPKATISS
ncbi:hypothetical protein F5Y11DRAFT_194835 [Daldinia sp. FL1419]|nr:hypothetical protein F5Y11DRAFT_194835 [Daldinia sp. FL1419]